MAFFPSRREVTGNVVVVFVLTQIETKQTLFEEQVMKIDITRVNVWAAAIEDKAGALAKKFETLAFGGANLEFIIARRTPEKSGRGVVYVTPFKGARQIRAAVKAGFKKSKSLQAIRVAATNRPGLASKLSGAIAEANINIRGFSGANMGRRAVFHIAFDSVDDLRKAMRALKAMAS